MGTGDNIAETLRVASVALANSVGTAVNSRKTVTIAPRSSGTEDLARLKAEKVCRSGSRGASRRIAKYANREAARKELRSCGKRTPISSTLGLDTTRDSQQNPAYKFVRRSAARPLVSKKRGTRAIHAWMDGAMYQSRVHGSRRLAARGCRPERLLQQLSVADAQRSAASRTAPPPAPAFAWKLSPGQSSPASLASSTVCRPGSQL